MIRLIAATCALAFAAAPLAYPQDAKASADPAPIRLDVAKAVELALSNNAALESTRIDMAMKQRKIDTQWNVFLPSVDLGLTLGRMNEAGSGIAVAPSAASYLSATGTFDEVKLTPYEVSPWSLSTSLSASLTLNYALFEAMRNLKLDYEAGRISHEQARLKLERDVRKSYWSILLLRENISLMEENLVAAQRRTKQAEDNYRAGYVPELTVLQARVAAENLKPVIEELKNGLDTSLAAFAMNLGYPRKTRIELEGMGAVDFAAQNLDGDELVSKAASGKFDILALRQSLALLESAKKLSWYQLYTPSLTLGFSVDPTLGDPWGKSWFEGDNWSQRSGMFRATLGFRLNGLFPYTREALGLVDMDDNARKLNTALALTIRGTELEIDSLLLKLEKSKGSVATLGLNVELAEKAYKLSEEAYRAGVKDLLDAQNAELELRKARLEVLKEKFNYLTGLIDLEYSVGVPFGTLSGSVK